MAAREICAAQLRLCYEATPQALLVTLFNGILLLVVLRPVVVNDLALTWFGLLLAMSVIRGWFYFAFLAEQGFSHNLRQWEIKNLFGALIAGALWGSSSVLLFAPQSMPHQVFLAFVVGGMATGAVTTLSAQKSAAFVFIFLACAPFVYRFGAIDHDFGAAMGLMTAVFMGMMMIAANRFHRNYYNALAESLRRETAEEELAQIAYFDPLTNLPNRRLFTDYLLRALAGARRQGSLIAVCYLDLDGFKPINDRYGYEAGDRVLVHAAQRLQNSVRADDVVARWGGDEFAVLLSNLDNTEACTVALRRLVEQLAAPQMLDGVAHALGASVGVTFAPGDTDDADMLLREADHAMYLAKKAGGNCYHIFDRERDGEDRRRGEARFSLRQALDQHELLLFYQPKVEMTRGEVYGAEALLRWQHPQRGLLAPGEFLPAWEDDASMLELDRWVLQSAIRQLDRWVAAGLRLVISVNVSAWFLHDDHVIGFLRELTDTYPATRGLIELEVTETRALNDIGRVSEVMTQCATMQVAFALDDFGTGFSSLVHLQRLPAHVLKIDAGFVRAMLDNDHDHNLLKGIIGLGKSLGKEVVAEGVETVEHGTLLLKLGCQRAQGYGIARPMPASDLADWIRRYTAPPGWGGPAGSGPQAKLWTVAS